MNSIILVRRIAVSVGAIGLITATPALAQTPVSTSVRISSSCAKCDLSHRLMEGSSLQGSNFSGSDFSHSNLSGAELNNANLAGASFNKTYMMRVEGQNVNLRKSILRDATLTEAVLTDSDLSFVDLKRADLTRANFKGSSFQRAVLKSTDAMNANFQATDMTGARLTHGNFSDASFNSAILRGADFGDADVANCDFTGADLSAANLFNASGLVQSQLDSACGNELTILPENMTVSICPEKEGLAKVAERVDTFAIIAAPTPPSAGAPVPYYLDSDRRSEASLDDMSELDLAEREINNAMRDLPPGSPTRAKLKKGLTHLQNAQQTVGD